MTSWRDRIELGGVVILCISAAFLLIALLAIFDDGYTKMAPLIFVSGTGVVLGLVMVCERLRTPAFCGAVLIFLSRVIGDATERWCVPMPLACFSLGLILLMLLGYWLISREERAWDKPTTSPPSG